MFKLFSSPEEKQELSAVDILQKGLDENGGDLRSFCMSFLNLTENDLDALSDIDSVQESGGPHIEAKVKDLLPHLNRQVREHSKFAKHFETKTEHAISKEIRNLANQPATLEKRDEIGKLIVLLFVLLKKRFQ